MILDNENTPNICRGNILISKDIDGEMKVAENIPTSYSKVTKRNYKEKNTMKISAPTSIVIIEPEMQKDIYQSLKKSGEIYSYQILGFQIDARLVNDGQAIIFDLYITLHLINN